MTPDRVAEACREASQSFRLENLEARTLLSFSSLDLSQYIWQGPSPAGIAPVAVAPVQVAPVQVAVVSDPCVTSSVTVSGHTEHCLELDEDGDMIEPDHEVAPHRLGTTDQQRQEEVYIVEHSDGGAEAVQAVVIVDAPAGGPGKVLPGKEVAPGGTPRPPENLVVSRAEQETNRVVAAPRSAGAKVARAESQVVVPAAALMSNSGVASSLAQQRASLLPQESNPVTEIRSESKTDSSLSVSSALPITIGRTAMLVADQAASDVRDVATEASAAIIPTNIATAMAAAPQALAGALVIATPIQTMSAQTTYNLAALRLPAAWLSDSLAAFADESASVTRRTIKRMDVRKAIAISLGVVAFDAMVLSAYFGRKQKKRTVQRTMKRTSFSSLLISEPVPA